MTLLSCAPAEFPTLAPQAVVGLFVPDLSLFHAVVRLRGSALPATGGAPDVSPLAALVGAGLLPGGEGEDEVPGEAPSGFVLPGASAEWCDALVGLDPVGEFVAVSGFPCVCAVVGVCTCVCVSM